VAAIEIARPERQKT